MDDYNREQLMPKKKPKRRWFQRIIKFTASALVFGVVAGGAASAYDYLSRPDKPKNIEKNENLADDKASSDITPTVGTPTPTTVEELNLVQTTTELTGIVSDVSDVVDKVMPSIVAINSSSTITNYNFFTGRQFYEPVEGSGSGIIIGQNEKSLLILTNNHVISGAETVEIVFSDETTAGAVVKGADVRSDIAVLEVSLKELSKTTLDTIKVARLGNSEQVKSGELVIAIGNALGYGQSVTVGYISAVEREVDIEGIKMELIQTDAAINPGNSGGALINMTGEVIGMNSVKYAADNVEGMGYAIPITDAIPMIEHLMRRVELDDSQKGYLGVDLSKAQEITPAFSQQFNMPIGIYINEVIADSPADKAGIKPGAIIVGVNGLSVETINDLINALSYYRVGETVSVQVSIRDKGSYITEDINVKLGKRP